MIPGPKLCECGPQTTITTTNSEPENLIPEEVMVLGKRFKVIFVEKHDTDTLDEEADGTHDRGNQVIKVRIGRHPDYIKDTVIHEFIHAIDESMGLGMTEKQVSRLATGLLALLNDNPDLKNYLLND